MRVKREEKNHTESHADWMNRHNNLEKRTVKKKKDKTVSFQSTRYNKESMGEHTYVHGQPFFKGQ